MVNNKYILLIDAVIVFGSLFIIAGLVGYTRPLVIAPLDDYVTSDSSVLFEFEKADLVLIDENLDFSSPREIYVEDNIVINLEPGIYYWKVAGALESSARQLTIESEVNLKIKAAEDGTYEVVNSGSSKLDVDVYDKGVLTGKITLDVDEGDSFEGDKIIGGQIDG